jgi:hypothetical protein
MSMHSAVVRFVLSILITGLVSPGFAKADAGGTEKIVDTLRAGVAWRQQEFAKLAPVDIDNKKWVTFKLRNMHDVDQWARAVLMFALKKTAEESDRKAVERSLMPIMQEIDRKNVDDLKALIARHGWFSISEFGPEADTNAWIIVQHATFDLPFMKSALTTLEPLARKGDSSPSSFALLYDRIAVNEGRAQTFGSQGSCEGKDKWIADPIEKPEGLAARRADMNLGPFEDYQRMMNGMCP